MSSISSSSNSGGPNLRLWWASTLKPYYTPYGPTVAPAYTIAFDEKIDKPTTDFISPIYRCLPLLGILGFLFLAALPGLIVYLTIKCDIVDECLSTPCQNEGTCIDASSTYVCVCPAGYEGDNCQHDKDECSLGTESCHCNALCTNTEGGFNCTCNDGYQGNGIDCTDTDECLTDTHTCHALAVCMNTDGNYTCACKDGYQGNGWQCEDKDECTLGTDNCHCNALCTNTAGGFTCTCKDGYQGNGTECTDTDECVSVTNTHSCHTSAICTNTDGNYTCACNSGYQGNGWQCDDINECDKNDTCHRVANCTNTEGSYTCACPAGFLGDGKCCFCNNGGVLLPKEGDTSCDIKPRCYYLHTYNLNKADAKSKCVDEGTELAQLWEGTGPIDATCSRNYGCEWDIVVKDWLAEKLTDADKTHEVWIDAYDCLELTNCPANPGGIFGCEYLHLWDNGEHYNNEDWLWDTDYLDLDPITELGSHLALMCNISPVVDTPACTELKAYSQGRNETNLNHFLCEGPPL